MPSISARAFGRFPDPGGGQERGLRSGTEATPQIAALAAAASLGRERMEEHTAALTDLKAYALETFQRGVPGLAVVSPGDAPHICAISLPGYPSQVVVRWLSDRGFCVSPALPAIGGRPAMSMPPCTCPKGCGTGCCGYPSAQRTPGRRWTSWPRPFWRPPGPGACKGINCEGTAPTGSGSFMGRRKKSCNDGAAPVQ